jgi:tryptophan-rich sensory protein
MGRVEHTSVARNPWSPAQFVAGLVGLFLTVLGGVALARLLPVSSMTEETTTVVGMGFTVVMAVITLLLGIVFLVGAGRPAGARAGMISLGVAMLAFGIVIFIEPDALSGALGVNQTSGVVYAVTGLVAAIAGIASPTIVSRRAIGDRVVDEDAVTHIT